MLKCVLVFKILVHTACFEKDVYHQHTYLIQLGKRKGVGGPWENRGGGVREAEDQKKELEVRFKKMR